MRVDYLVDTDWVIHYLREESSIVQTLKSIMAKGECLSISLITYGELWEGIQYSRNPERHEKELRDFLNSGVSIVGLNLEILKIFGEERGRLRKNGTMIGDLDLLIASTCKANNAILLTNNEKHYKLIDGLKFRSCPIRQV
jgi:tRNA(fMet)-specific endonuclease VapC